MRTPTLLLAAAVAVLAVLPLDSAHPAGCGCRKPQFQQIQPPKGAYLKATKSSSSSSSLAKSASGNEQEVKANSLTGEYSQRASSAASNSVAKSAESNEQSYEAYTPGYVYSSGLLARLSGESDYDYYVRVFKVDVANAESINAFYANVFKQYKGESNADYLNRVTFIFTKVYPKLDCRCNQAYLKYLQKYYLIAYAKLNGESDVAWFNRVLTRTTENEAEYLVKVAILKKYINFVNWSLVNIDSKYKTGFVLISSKGTSSSSARSLDEDSSSSKTVKSVLTEEDVKKTFAKIDSEDITSYYKRIVSKVSSTESTEEYVRTLTLVKKCYPTLSLWYDVRYIGLVKNYYSSLYAKLANEAEDKYFLRIVTKEAYETDDQCAQRVEVVRELFPNLVLWSDAKYYKTFTQKFYQTYYKKTTSEDEVTYFKRIVTKAAGESDVVFINRLGLIKQTFPDLAVWYSPEFLNISKPYFIIKYTKASSESEESLFKRIVTKEVQETEEQAVKRLALVQGLYPNLALWTDLKYYDLIKNVYLFNYKKSSSEDEVTYFKRIVAKIPEESEITYINRLSLVKRTLPSLNLWYSDEFLSITKQYYIARYTKTNSETEESLYKRVVVKETGETVQQWAQRVQLVHLIYPNWALWSNVKYIDLVKDVYLNFYKKTTTEDELSYYKRLISRIASETDDVYIQRISTLKRIFSPLDLWYSKQYLDIVKPFYLTTYTKTSSETEESLYKRVVVKEVGETDELWAQRVETVHQLFPNWALWYDTKYYDLTKSVYTVYYKKSTSEDEISYFKRLTAKNAAEKDTVFINRLTLIKNTYPSLPLWYSPQYLEITKSYYIAKYARASSETEESLYKRVVVKEVGETDELWAQRVETVHQLFPNWALWYDTKYYSLTKSVFATYYKKSTSEDEVTYYKRVTAKTPAEKDSVFISRLSLIKYTYPSLALWYSPQYLDITKSYYIAKYTRASSETEESLYKRVVVKEDGESDDLWAKRVEIVHRLYPNWALWYDTKYYSLTKSVISIYYRKSASEDEIAYFKRITTRTVQETDAVYLGRLSLIERTFTGLSLWSSVENLNIIKSYYLLKYTKQAGETDDAYFARLVAKESCDVSDQVYVRRLYIVQLLTSSSALWYDAKFYDKFTKTFYSLYYSKLDGESCDGWLTRAITLLPGETNENAIRRVTLIKQATGSCGCWTLDALSKVQAAKTFSSEYIAKIRSTFFAVSYTKTASSSSSATKSATSEQNENVVSYKRGGC